MGGGMNNQLLVPLETAARLVHAVWCGFQLGAGQNYNEEPDADDIRSTIASIRDYLRNPDRTPEQSHTMWTIDRVSHGWVYGPVKDKRLLTHPDLVPYDQLPDVERRKDENHLMAIRSVLKALSISEV